MHILRTCFRPERRFSKVDQMKRLRAKKYNIGDCSEVCDVIFFYKEDNEFPPPLWTKRIDSWWDLFRQTLSFKKICWGRGARYGSVYGPHFDTFNWTGLQAHMRTPNRLEVWTPPRPSMPWVLPWSPNSYKAFQCMIIHWSASFLAF